MIKNSSKTTKVFGWLLFLIGLSSFGLQMVFLFVRTRYQVEYIDDRLFYLINIICLICLLSALFLLLTLNKYLKIISVSILVVLVTGNIFVLTDSNKAIKNITSISPNFQNVLSIKEHTKMNEAIYYRPRYGILARPHDRLPNRTTGEFKVEWLANDIAAVTYIATDETIQQYIGTYGDRGGGTSYYYVGAEIQGEWTSETIELISAPEGIFITESGRTELFNWDNIHQFGTLAVVLTKENEAIWTVSLDENFEVHSDSLKPKTGNISLYKATMEANQPITLEYK